MSRRTRKMSVRWSGLIVGKRRIEQMKNKLAARWGGVSLDTDQSIQRRSVSSRRSQCSPGWRSIHDHAAKNAKFVVENAKEV